MPNTVLIPVSAALYFNREAPFSTIVSPLSVAARIAYDNIGGLTVTSYVTGASAIERFRVEGTQGSLFSVTDVLTGVLFSVNDISGLPILTVQDTDTLIAGAFNTNTFVISGTRIGVGVNIGTTKVTVSGSLSASGTIFASGGNSNQWNSSFTTTNANTAADSFDLSYTGDYAVPLPIFTVPPLRFAIFNSSGIQTAILSSGKCINTLNLAGYSNATLDNVTVLSSADIVGIRDNFTASQAASNALTKLQTISFPALVYIGAGLTITGGGFSSTSQNLLRTVNFPALAAIGGTFTGITSVTNSLADLSFPSLSCVGGGFQLFGSSGSCSSLSALNFPALTFVGSNFQISNTLGSLITGLTAINFPALAVVGGSINSLLSNSSVSIISIDFPSLSSVAGTLGVFGGVNFNPVRTINFPALAKLGSSFYVHGSTGTTNALTTVSLPALAIVGADFNITSVTNATTLNFTNFFIGSTLKHLNGNFAVNSAPLDKHNAWAASTYYPSYTIFTAPAASFSSTPTGTTVTVNINNHGLQTGDQIQVSGIVGQRTGTHPYNTHATVTRIDANNFSYAISSATTLLPTGTAIIQRIEVAVTPVTKNGRKYICTGAGTSGATEPTWPTTVGNTVVDGTVTWTCSEMSLANIMTRLEALDGTNQTIRYGANRFVSTVNTVGLITINSISTAAGVATITTASSHGFTTGTQIVISGCTGTALRYNGVWTATSTGSTTFTIPVPTDLNGVAGAGTMRCHSHCCPQYTGSLPIPAATVTGTASDAHLIVTGTTPINPLLDSEAGTPLPDFPAGHYTRNGNVNGFARYSCTENGWDIWYDTTFKRWVNSPSAYTGNNAAVRDYLYTPQAINISSTSSANPAVITSSANHGIATGAVFTVVIEGCSNTALNGSWTATSTGATTFTIPVDGSGGATTNSGTVAVLNQTFNGGRFMTLGNTAPVQAVQQTITTSSPHGFTNGDFIHFYGAVGTHATSINDLNTSSTAKSLPSSITVTNSTTFTLVRYATTQPFIGSYSFTTLPHMRDPSINDVAYYNALKMRSRGVAVNLSGATGT